MLGTPAAIFLFKTKAVEVGYLVDAEKSNSMITDVM